MSNAVNVFNIPGETLAQFEAKVVSDGTYGSVMNTLKIDQPGQPAAATEINVACGELWSNMVDDYIKATYPLVKAASGSSPPQKEGITTEVVVGADVVLADLLTAAPLANSLRLFLNGLEQSEGVGADYTVAGTAITWLANTGTAVNMDALDRLNAYYQA